ncbi:MAG: hypothetical protein IJ761_04875 [Bacteroidales bacterium]|nr:hypothetical protein [Bacteroidales bacterium]
MKKRQAILTLLLVGVVTTVSAQFRQSIYINGTLPTGKFASSVDDSRSMVPLTYEEVGKDATLGFGLGYRVSYWFDIGVGYVAPFAEVDFLYNLVGGEWRDKYLDLDMKNPNYFNFPLLGGVSYKYDQLWDDIVPFGEFAIGTDMLWITREGKSVSDDPNNYYAYKANFSLSWMLGAGCFFGRHVSAGLYYYYLGKHPIDYTSKTLSNNNVASLQLSTNEAAGHGRETRTVGSVALRIGFHF